MNDKTYAVTFTLTVHPHSDAHLQSEQAIRDEVRSWLEGLRATVHPVTVTRKEQQS